MQNYVISGDTTTVFYLIKYGDILKNECHMSLIVRTYVYHF